MDDSDWGADGLGWERLARQLQNGDCTPFIGAGACAGTLPTGETLSQEIAGQFRYPFMDSGDLAHVSQYAVIRNRDRVDFKRTIASHLRSFGHPDFSRLGEPHGLLARYPLPTYLTTNYDDFMLRALKAEGKEPQTFHFPWFAPAPMRFSEDLRSARAPARQPRPTANRPIVYYLHGSCQDPESIVITEEDYHEFLTNLSMDNAGEQRLPTAVIAALTRRPLLFVGYRLNDWTFRVLFRGLIKPMARVLHRGHVSVQLAPPLVDGNADTERRAKEYLARYFDELNVSVYLGSAEDFFVKLGAHMGGSNALGS